MTALVDAPVLSDLRPMLPQKGGKKPVSEKSLGDHENSNPFSKELKKATRDQAGQKERAKPQKEEQPTATGTDPALLGAATAAPLTIAATVKVPTGPSGLVTKTTLAPATQPARAAIATLGPSLTDKTSTATSKSLNTAPSLPINAQSTKAQNPSSSAAHQKTDPVLAGQSAALIESAVPQTMLKSQSPSAQIIGRTVQNDLRVHIAGTDKALNLSPFQINAKKSTPPPTAPTLSVSTLMASPRSDTPLAKDIALLQSTAGTELRGKSNKSTLITLAMQTAKTDKFFTAHTPLQLDAQLKSEFPLQLESAFVALAPKQAAHDMTFTITNTPEALTPAPMQTANASPEASAFAAPTVQITQNPTSFNPNPSMTSATTVLDTQNAQWIEEIQNSVTLTQNDGVQEIELTLSPEHLGRVQIRLELRDGATGIFVITETPEAAKLFDDHKSDLASALNDKGLDMTDHQAQDQATQNSQDERKARAQALPNAEREDTPNDIMLNTPAGIASSSGVNLLA